MASPSGGGGSRAFPRVAHLLRLHGRCLGSLAWYVRIGHVLCALAGRCTPGGWFAQDDPPHLHVVHPQVVPLPHEEAVSVRVHHDHGAGQSQLAHRGAVLFKVDPEAVFDAWYVPPAQPKCAVAAERHCMEALHELGQRRRLQPRGHAHGGKGDQRVERVDYSTSHPAGEFHTCAGDPDLELHLARSVQDGQPGVPLRDEEDAVGSRESGCGAQGGPDVAASLDVVLRARDRRDLDYGIRRTPPRHLERQSLSAQVKLPRVDVRSLDDPELVRLGTRPGHQRRHRTVERHCAALARLRREHGEPGAGIEREHGIPRPSAQGGEFHELQRSFPLASDCSLHAPNGVEDEDPVVASVADDDQPGCAEEAAGLAGQEADLFLVQLEVPVLGHAPLIKVAGVPGDYWVTGDGRRFALGAAGDQCCKEQDDGADRSVQWRAVDWASCSSTVASYWMSCLHGVS